ncbi:Transcriptional regulator of nonfermentable carbon utilization [Borealophlyctis nickersoniae]|nr:Transcriptional regulator of nonfermentable carbon utilization [Borealophlyctis nickersoniae]
MLSAPTNLGDPSSFLPTGLPDGGSVQTNETTTVQPEMHPPETKSLRRESIATMNSPPNAGMNFGVSGADVYKSVVRPYDYREGFHYLVKYVKERMEKNDIMRICRALAQFRPSFMAQIMNLSEDDLIFMEKCFQRTLMEFDKLIGFSGTPTVLWRRTGEIALVGKEFSILTQWSREELLSKRTYIYELMDNGSAVDYWEKFSLIAFDNSQQSVMTTCTLLSPTGRPVPCAFCFTIKRDIFDVPLAVVGNFLPLFRAL